VEKDKWTEGRKLTQECYKFSLRYWVRIKKCRLNHIVMCWVVHATNMTGYNSDDRIY
jgi:hypothetical protein